jgi:membrane associated rhomboid family serine protease
MFPLGDYLPTLRTPVITYALILLMGATWLFVQRAGADERVLVASICQFGLIPGELTGRALTGTSTPVGEGLACAVTSRGWVDYVTPVTSMFLHGGWLHILGNAWFLRIFGDNVEDAMGRGRFTLFYLVCGLAAATAQVAIDPASRVPMVGASGAISGVMGAYLVLYPREPIKTLFILVILIRVIAVPAWLILLYWFGLQVLAALPQLTGVETSASSGVAVLAHVGGFVAGVLLAKPFTEHFPMAGRRAA